MSVKTAGAVMIVMPAFNRECFIAEAIDSIRSQTFPHWKLVIVDDGSTDKTLSIAKGHAQRDDRIEIFELNHSGESFARNTALSRADLNTEYVAFLDSDDVWYADLLQTLVDAVGANKDCVGAHGIARIVNDSGSDSFNKTQTWPGIRRSIKGYFPRKLDANSPTDFSMLVYGNFVPIGATIVRKWVFEKIGLFNQKAPVYSDWEMWLRISTVGPFAFVNKELYKYRIHSANLPKPREVIFTREKKLFASLYKEGNLTDQQRTTLKRGYRLHQLYHGMNCVQLSAKSLMQGKLASSGKELLMAIDRVRCALALKPFD